MPPTIRRLVPAMAPDYRALMLEAYATHVEAFTSSLAERAGLPLSWWESRLADGPGAGEVVLGAFVDGHLAGVAGVSFEPRLKIRHKATLFGMYVPQRWRRSRLGTGLVNAALAEARAREGVELMQLTVTAGNDAAERLYQACGFVAYGVEPLAVALGDRYVAKIHMWRPLGALPADQPMRP